MLYKKSYDSDVTTNAPPISLESDRVGNDGQPRQCRLCNDARCMDSVGTVGKVVCNILIVMVV